MAWSPSRYNQQHLYNIRKYLKEVRESYTQSIHKFVNAYSFTAIDKDVPFNIDHYPVLKKSVEAEIKVLAKNLNNIIVNGVTGEWELANLKNDNMIKGVVRGIVPPSTFEAYRDRNLKARAAFIKQVEEGLTLSDRVWNHARNYMVEVEEALAVGISKGTAAADIAKHMQQYLDNPTLLFNQLKEPGILLGSRKKRKGGQGVYRSSYKNALRLARTETNNAYHRADYERRMDTDFVLGIEIKRGSVKYDCDICESLQGFYPKEFLFQGWHPNCYSDDTEVYTSNGWKLFKDATFDDKFLSLNKDNFNLEYVPATKIIKLPYTGDMVRFHNLSLDMLVTPQHPIIYINKSGKWSEKPAQELIDRPLYLRIEGLIQQFIAERGPHLIKKDVIPYSGHVYDVELEKNHTLYIRRNGKCVWGSNCLCFEVPVLPSDEEMAKALAAELKGEKYEYKGYIKKYPKNYQIFTQNGRF